MKKFLLGAVALASIAVATSAHAVGITRVSAADFVAGSGLITFSEFANGTVNPTYAPAVYGGDAASPTVTFDGWFLGQSLRVERPPMAIHEGGDSILFRFGGHLAVERMGPPRRGLAFFLIKEARVEHRIQGDIPVFGDHPFGLRVELADRRDHFFEFLWGHQVGLRNHEHIGKLNLVHQKIGHRALILIVSPYAQIGELLEHLKARELEQGG